MPAWKVALVMLSTSLLSALVWAWAVVVGKRLDKLEKGEAMGGAKTQCPKCGKEVLVVFPMHICRPSTTTRSGLPEVADTKVMQETGHATMLARVQAAGKMVSQMWYAASEGLEGEPWTVENTPNWLRNMNEIQFLQGMMLTYSSYDEAQISITAQQWRWIKDIYDRSLL